MTMGPMEYLTAALVVITGIYAYLTHKISKASEGSVAALREQSEALLRPYITVSLFVRPHTPILYLRIQNTGRTGAKNVKLTLDRDFYQFGESSRPERNLRALSAFSSPIDSMSPGDELIFGLAQGWVIFGKDARPDVTPSQFNLSATYEFAGKCVVESTPIDLRPYIGSEGERDPIVEELERIKHVLERAK